MTPPHPMLCPHPYALRVGPRPLCYWCVKQRALNGGRSKLDAEQLAYVGVVTDTGQPDQQTNHGSLVGWLQAINPSNIDQRLEELDRRLDLAPNWLAFAKALIEEKGNGS
jgi:hypothetical protein